MKNKMNKLAVLIAAVGLVGCASVSSVTNKMVNNQTEGVIYGTGGYDYTVTTKQVCDAIKNKDPRCADADSYFVVPVFSSFGFADGARGINALVQKDFPGFDVLRHNKITGDKTMPYVKARVVPGQLGELLEIVSVNGDGKCYWYGMPRTGGVVCPAYGYDYRKDYQGVVFR